jgi:hypothetical protein
MLVAEIFKIIKIVRVLDFSGDSYTIWQSDPQNIQKWNLAWPKYRMFSIFDIFMYCNSAKWTPIGFKSS